MNLTNEGMKVNKHYNYLASLLRQLKIRAGFGPFQTEMPNSLAPTRLFFGSVFKA